MQLGLIFPSVKALHSDAVLQESEACRALISEAQDRQDRHGGLHTDARPATTQTYIYIHKTEENGETRHTFCYCLGTNQWKDVGTDLLEAAVVFPDPPGCCFTSYAEKVKCRIAYQEFLFRTVTNGFCFEALITFLW